MGGVQPEVGRSSGVVRRGSDPPRIDAAIAELAERQWGVVGRAQLLAIGAERTAIDRRIRAGRLQALHRGVYAAGHRRVGIRGRWIAALLACGPEAVLSHRAAAALWELRRAGDERVDITTVMRSGRRSPPGIVLHRARRLAAAEVASRDGIPCTSPARTLLDLAGTVQSRELEKACERAEQLRLLDMRAIEAALRRGRGRRGGRALRALLGEWTGLPTLTRSELEERFLALVRAAALPQPRLNVPILIDGGRRHVEVDALWERQRLIVELDGHQTHGTRAAFERDRARDVALQAAGYRVARFTWRQVTERPREVAACSASCWRWRPADRFGAGAAPSRGMARSRRGDWLPSVGSSRPCPHVSPQPCPSKGSKRCRPTVWARCS